MSKCKVGYLGVFRDGTGFSHAAIHTALALDAVGVDVACRNIKLATQIVEPPQRISELCQKSTEGVTHVIQHILAPYLTYVAGAKNIGYFYTETTHFRPSSWQYHANLMDEMWVSSEQNEKACRDSGVTVPIKVVDIPCDPRSFDRNNIAKLKVPTSGRYAFYHIGDYSSRKNTYNLIKCFLEEFSRDDNVVLILKSYVEGVSAEDSNKIILQDIANLKQSLRKGKLDNYPPIVVIGDYLPSEDMLKLHASCNCFITLERGAAWNLPAFEAAAMGNWVICNGWGGQNRFLLSNKNYNADMTDYYMDSVHGMIRTPYQTIYTAHEKWAEPNYAQFKEFMRNAYEEQIAPHEVNRQNLINSFSYAKVGERIRELLHV